MSSERTSRQAVPSRKARSSLSPALAPQERTGEPGERRLARSFVPSLATLRREVEAHLAGADAAWERLIVADPYEPFSSV